MLREAFTAQAERCKPTELMACHAGLANPIREVATLGAGEPIHYSSAVVELYSQPVAFCLLHSTHRKNSIDSQVIIGP